MTVATISQWLRSPNELPDARSINAAVEAWPWFSPARLMAAAYDRAHNGVTDKCLETIRLYGGPWPSAYLAVTGGAPRPYQPARVEDLRAEPLIEAEQPAAPVAQLQEGEAEAPQQATLQDDPAPGEPEHIQLPPLFSEDYFRHEGINAPEEAPAAPAEPQPLMIVMSFAEWLNHFKVKTEQEESEAREKRALRSMWQQEKLAAALEDEPDEIPEEVFEMAVSSITREESLVSESLAAILEKQEKWSAAAEMYRKLAMKNPSKSSYFAARAEAAKKHLL